MRTNYKSFSLAFVVRWLVGDAEGDGRCFVWRKMAVRDQMTHNWYTRPVFFVAEVDRALRFYIDMLGFEKSWHEGDGAGGVCQVNRAGCEIILCEDATRRDKGRLYVELTVDGFSALRGEIVERSVPSEKSWWGSEVIKIVDPDGNELLFPVSERPNSSKDSG